MKIVDASLDIVSIPLTEPLATSFGTVNHATSAIVQLLTSDGMVGIGEAAPLYQFLDEGYESLPVVMEKYLFPALHGLDPYDVGTLHRRLDRRVKGNHFAKGAIDIAMHDLAGKAAGVPVYKLLGGKLRERVPLIWSIGSCNPEETLNIARSAFENDITTFMIKCGALVPATDIQRIALLRDKLGDVPILIVDANGGWSPATAVRTINALEPYDILFVEQPVPHWNRRGFAIVAQRVTVPLSADESLTTVTSAFELAASESASIFSIKIAKHGGYSDATAIAALAAATGRECFVNSMIETDLGVASSLQFALSAPNLTPSGHALMSALRIEDRILKKPLPYRNGTISAPEGDGLGAELDESKLEQYRRPVTSDR